MNGDGIVGRVRNSTSGASLLNGLSGTLNTLQNAASVATLGALPRSPSSSSKVYDAGSSSSAPTSTASNSNSSGAGSRDGVGMGRRKRSSVVSKRKGKILHIRVHAALPNPPLCSTWLSLTLLVLIDNGHWHNS